MIFNPRYWFWPKVSLKLDREVCSALDAGEVPVVIDDGGTIKIGDMLLMRRTGFFDAYFLVGIVTIQEGLMVFAEPENLQWIGRRSAHRISTIAKGLLPRQNGPGGL